VEWLVIPLIFYFSIIYISKYYNISAYIKALLSFINLLISYGLSSLSYKLYNSELNKSDIILSSIFYNLRRRWKKEDYLNEGFKFLENEKIFLNLDQIYNQINPTSMCLWKENLLLAVSQHKQLLIMSANKKTFLSSLSELFVFNSYSETTKYIIVSVGFIGAVLLVVGIKDFLLFPKFDKDISFSFYSKEARNLNSSLTINSPNDLIQIEINKKLSCGIDNQYHLYEFLFDLQEQILDLSRMIKVFNIRGNVTNQEIIDFTEKLDEIWYRKHPILKRLNDMLVGVHRNNE
jgi:hypothetical protein